MDWLGDSLAALQGWMFEHLLEPALFLTGWIGFDEMAYEGLETFLLGGVQVAATFAILRPLEGRFPVEVWKDRKGLGSDVFYTLLHRLGGIPLLMFALLGPAAADLETHIRLAGYSGFNLEDALPGMREQPAATLLAYLVVIDFSAYWRHRLQHRLAWWWSLHSLHHSQRKLSFWSDDRTHLLDDLLQGLWEAGLALAIGVPPAQFGVAVLFSRFIESLSHANIRLRVGSVAERLVVSPRFHRCHHGIGTGEDGPQRGCNFATLLPFWDILFGTADFKHGVGPTGVRDQLEGKDYGSGFLSEQWLGLRRLMDVLTGRSASAGNSESMPARTLE